MAQRLANEPSWLVPFVPIGRLSGPHAQTLAGNFWRRPALAIPNEPTEIEVDPADRSRILCHCHWQAPAVRAQSLTVLLVHGLEGSSDSRYIQGITARAWAAGCNVIRMNMRNCGGTESWTPTLYHSGLSADIRATLDCLVPLHGLQRVAVAGYSMGGNLVLKLAGELGPSAPPWLIAAVAVSPAADLAASADALHEPANRVYEWNFLRNLMRRFHRKARLYPAIYDTAGVGPVCSVREFDDRITAPYSGFAGAADYYYRAAAARVIDRIAIPTLILHAQDDPFIRLRPETRGMMRANASIRLIETEHGGHCAFLAAASEQSRDRHWAEATLMRFLLTAAGMQSGS